MRTFIAIDLPQDAKDELAALQRQLARAPAKLSPSHDFHLTLKFLGEITPEKAELVKSCLGTIKFQPFTAKLSVIGAFPSENYAKVVWVGLEPEDLLVELQQIINDALEKAFPKEKNFKPHLTLARVKIVIDRRQFVMLLRQMRAKPVEFIVNEFKLKKSTLSPGGAIYEDLAAYRSN